MVDTLEDTEMVDTLEDTEVVRTSIGTWDTEMDNAVDICGTCDSDSEDVIYCKPVTTRIRVDTYGPRDTNYDSEEDIEMILTSIGTDTFELYNTELDAGHTAISQIEEDISMVPARMKGFQCEQIIESNYQCEQILKSNCKGERDCNQIDLQSSEHVTEL